MPELVAVGQIGRDLVLGVERLPEGGGAAPVRERRELLGGKGANQAVASRQLGADVALVAVVGADGPGEAVLAQARADGIDVSAVVRREGASTALLVDVVEADATRRLLEDVPGGTLLRPEDVRAAAPLVAGSAYVLLQLQQPGEAILEALAVAAEAGVPVVADGAVEDPDVREELLARTTVLRADATEAELLVGRGLDGVDATVEAARELLGAGPDVVALAAGEAGNVVAWRGGSSVVPLLSPGPTVDPTGAGDSFVAGLTVALLRGHDAETAGWWAAAASSLTVTRLGGRPDLDVTRVEELVREARQGGRRARPEATP